MEDLITSAAYARHAGITKGAVSQMISAGKIPAYDQSGRPIAPGTPGKKFVRAAEADHARGQARVRVNLDDDEDPVRIEEQRPAPQPHNATLTKARTASEAHRAQLLRLELDERRGKLIPVDAVESALLAISGKVVAEVDTLPGCADDAATAFTRDGIPGLRRFLRDTGRRLRERIADALSLAGAEGDDATDDEAAA